MCTPASLLRSASHGGMVRHGLLILYLCSLSHYWLTINQSPQKRAYHYYSLFGLWCIRRVYLWSTPYRLSVCFVLIYIQYQYMHKLCMDCNSDWALYIYGVLYNGTQYIHNTYLCINIVLCYAGSIWSIFCPIGPRLTASIRVKIIPFPYHFHQHHHKNHNHNNHNHHH